MPRPTIEAVTADTLAAFSQFLHEHLDSSRSPAQWQQALSTNWLPERPNFGFVLLDDGRIVGGIGALYAKRRIRGQIESVCNVTSWCVLDAYRKESMRLAIALLSQPGFTYTDFSPTKVVGGTLRFLKFQPIDERQTVCLNLPRPAGGMRVLSDPAAITSALGDQDRADFEAHIGFPWLRQIAVGNEDDWCHVIYKRGHFKGLPSARILHVGNPEVFTSGFAAVARHLLMRGMVSTHVETRRLRGSVWPSKVRSGFNAKLFRSDRLGEDDIDYLYSETVAMDL